MTTSVCDKVFTFAELQEKHKDLFDKINYCAGLAEYKLHQSQFQSGLDYYDFTCSINAWRFDCLLTDKQWKALAQLCINYKADIGEVIRGCHFETDRVTIVDGPHTSHYSVPTNLCGWVKNLYFLIDVDGRCCM